MNWQVTDLLDDIWCCFHPLEGVINSCVIWMLGLLDWLIVLLADWLDFDFRATVEHHSIFVFFSKWLFHQGIQAGGLHIIPGEPQLSIIALYRSKTVACFFEPLVRLESNFEDNVAFVNRALHLVTGGIILELTAIRFFLDSLSLRQDRFVIVA